MFYLKNYPKLIYYNYNQSTVKNFVLRGKRHYIAASQREKREEAGERRDRAK